MRGCGSAPRPMRLDSGRVEWAVGRCPSATRGRARRAARWEDRSLVSSALDQATTPGTRKDDAARACVPRGGWWSSRVASPKELPLRSSPSYRDRRYADHCIPTLLHRATCLDRPGSCQRSVCCRPDRMYACRAAWPGCQCYWALLRHGSRQPVGARRTGVPRHR